MMRFSIAENLRNDSQSLQATLRGLDPGSARIEAQCLLQAALQVNRAYLLTHPEQQLDSTQQARYSALVERRLQGEPIAYILGEREFFGLKFKVSPATLIPRADTELLVELALARIPESAPPPYLSGNTSAEEFAAQNGFRALDLGTGSGAIALSIAHARPRAEVVAVDASREALDVARENAQRLTLGNVRLLHSDWFSALQDEHFDLIVSNPPYINEDDTHLGQGDLRFEPRSALASGADGLDDIRRIIFQAKRHLHPKGGLLIEHGYDQAVRVRDLFDQAGFADVFSAHDLAGIERVSGGRA
jgi:release factor glutamine methyltransferase